MVVMAMMVVVVLWRKERKSSTRLVFFFCKSLSPFSRGSARKGAKCKVEDDLKVDQRRSTAFAGGGGVATIYFRYAVALKLKEIDTTSPGGPHIRRSLVLWLYAIHKEAGGQSTLIWNFPIYVCEDSTAR